MINDNTIDTNTARYWCMFMDKKLLSLLDNAMQYDEKDGKRLAEIALKIKNNKNFSESINEGVWNRAQIAHQTAFPMATGNPFQPNFRGVDSTSGELNLQDQQKNNVIAGATVAGLIGLKAMPGAWAALIGALGTTGSWLANIVTSIGTTGIMAIVGGIVSVSTYLYPRIAKLIKEFNLKGNIIAKCQFEADGQTYQAVFSANTGRWELLYTNNRWIRFGTSVPPNDIKTFFESQFFKQFLSRCEKYLNSVYNDEARLKCLQVLANMADKSSKKDIQKIINLKPIINNYLIPRKYLT